MWWLMALVALYVADWCHQPSWQYLYGTKLVAVVFALHAGYYQSTTFRARSIFAFLAAKAWADFIEYLAWWIFVLPYDFFWFTFVVFVPWFMWIWSREYRISDPLNEQNVCLLFLRPIGVWNTILSFFGLPFSSVCVVAGGYVWSFRQRSGRYERTKYSASWLKSHDVFDTGVKTTPQVIRALTDQIGSTRGFHCKCIYQIRAVLDLLGLKPKTIFHYIPGVFAMQVKGRRENKRTDG